MGHMYPGAQCKAIMKQVYARGAVSIKEIVDHCIKHKIWLSCAEGLYEEPYMISMAVEELIGLYTDHKVLEPVLDTPEREAFWDKWDGDTYWDEPDDPEYLLYIAIPWKFSPGQRAKYPNYISWDHIEH